MRRTASFIAVILILTASIMAFEPAKADGKTLTVPTEYPTIKEAIQNTTDGDTILVKQGSYNENIVIDRAITLRGEDTNTTIINGNLNDTVIQILHDNVTVTGLTVTYSSTTPNDPRRYYQHNLPDGWMKLNGWSAIGYPLDGGYFNRIGHWRLPGIHIQNATHCNISGNIIADCGEGIWLWKAAQNSISGNILLRNDYGLHIESSGDNSILGNTFSSNGGGIWLPAPYWKMTGWGTDPLTVNNTFAENNFISNQKAVETQSLTNTTNYWDNGSIGNYWDVNNGTDSNQDGICDEPYQIMGEYFTGGYLQNGVWREQVYRVDNYPLIKPFNTTSMFTVHQDAPLNQPTPESTDYTFVEVAASIAVILAIAVLILYFKRHQDQF